MFSIVLRKKARKIMRDLHISMQKAVDEMAALDGQKRLSTKTMSLYLKPRIFESLRIEKYLRNYILTREAKNGKN